jgi:hypothetical protein
MNSALTPPEDMLSDVKLVENRLMFTRFDMNAVFEWMLFEVKLEIFPSTAVKLLDERLTAVRFSTNSVSTVRFEILAFIADRLSDLRFSKLAELKTTLSITHVIPSSSHHPPALSRTLLLSCPRELI